MPIGHHRRRRDHHRHHHDHHSAHHHHLGNHRYRRFRQSRDYHPQSGDATDRIAAADPKVFLDTVYSVDPDGKPMDAGVHWIVGALTAALKSVQPKGQSVLNIVASPELCSSAALSSCFEKVYLTGNGDYGEHMVKEWLTHGKERFNWNPYFSIIAQGEGEDQCPVRTDF